VPDYGPSGWDQALGGVGTGASVVGATAMTKMAFFACVSGETLIKTLAGDRELRQVEIGNMVLTPDGYREVIDKDYGAPHPGNNEFVKLTIDNHSIILTATHEIGGKQAIDLKPGQVVETVDGPAELRGIEDVIEDVPDCGDLKLADGATEYLAGGIFVESMFGRERDR